MSTRASRLVDRSTTPVTAACADRIRRAGDTQFWLVVDVIECAALLLGEVSPAVKAQAARLLKPTIEERSTESEDRCSQPIRR